MCTATIPLESYSHSHCQLDEGHDGPHETEAWGPRIEWPNLQAATA